MDFLYLPTFDGTIDDGRPNIRVPILPDAYHIDSSKTPHLEADGPIMKPEIYSATEVHEHSHAPSAMSDVADNHAVDMDPFALTETVGKAARNVMGQAGKEAGVLRQVWAGLMDDLFGKKGSKAV